MWRRSKGPSARKLKLNHTCQAMKDGNEVGSQRRTNLHFAARSRGRKSLGFFPGLFNLLLLSLIAKIQVTWPGILENSVQDLVSFHNAEISWKNERQFRLHGQAQCHTATVAIYPVTQLWSTFSKVSCAFKLFIAVSTFLQFKTFAFYFW